MNQPQAWFVSFSGARYTRTAFRYMVDGRTRILTLNQHRRMDTTETDENSTSLVKNSVLYKEFLAEREEILRHKWIESEKVGHDIGFEKALLDWIVKHRSAWRERRQKQVNPD